ncbi:MAG: polyprenyl synthetase family protein [Bifidobacteriaceae bacterium]|nr:polyprenyl synthetase family protein [Bifidobacteriaceae bacterium]
MNCPPAATWFDPEDVRREVMLGVAKATIGLDGSDLIDLAGWDLRPALDPASLELLRGAVVTAADGGKLLRARLLLTAWATFVRPRPGKDASDSTAGRDGPAGRGATRIRLSTVSAAGRPTSALGYGAAVRLAAALELFQASALVHDDVVDRANLRRGRPATHRWLRAQTRGQFGARRAGRLGRDLAVLVGDLLLVASDERAHAGLSDADPLLAGSLAAAFDSMRSQVMAGQFFDTLAPAVPMPKEAVAPGRAVAVAVAKSANYSVAYPLVIGALAGGAAEADRSALMRFGTHLGLAFQLRDDLLGVFGDPAATGKPAGGDLSEGKRTVLLAFALRRLPGAERRRLEELVASGARPAEVAEARELVARSGAAREVERLIADCHRTALTALAAIDQPELGPLERLAAELIDRRA